MVLIFPSLCMFLSDYTLSEMGLDRQVGGVSVGQGQALFFPLHTLKRSVSHLKHVLLLFYCVGFGSFRRTDNDRGLNRQGTRSLDKLTSKKEDGNTQANKKASFEAAGPSAAGEAETKTNRCLLVALYTD